MTDFNGHIISALWCTFVKGNLVNKLDFCSPLLLITNVDGFPLSFNVEVSATCSFFQKTITEDSSHFSV